MVFPLHQIAIFLLLYSPFYPQHQPSSLAYGVLLVHVCWMNEQALGEGGTSFPPWYLIVMTWDKSPNHTRSVVSLHKMGLMMLHWPERKSINQMLYWKPSQKIDWNSDAHLWVVLGKLSVFSPPKGNGTHFYRDSWTASLSPWNK